MGDFFGPFWLDRPSIHSGGVDHLGLRQPGLNMADALLPGITNTTEHARYYTVIAWMYRNAKSLSHLRILESAFVQATRLHSHEEGASIRGVVGTRSLPVRDENHMVVLKTESDIVSVLDAAFYGPSAKTLGVAGPISRNGIGYTSLARRLAEKVEISERDIPNRDDIRVKASSIEPISWLCFCRSPGKSERKLLEEIFFRTNERRGERYEKHIDGPRRRSMALILHAIEPGVDDEPLLLQRFLDWRMGWGKYQPPEEFFEEAYGFAILALRWFFRHALETVWAVFGRLIADYAFTGHDVAPYVDVILLKALGERDWLPRSCATTEEIYSDLKEKPGLEFDGYKLIEDCLDDEPEKAAIIAAVQLISIGKRINNLLDESRYYRLFPSLGDPFWVSMTTFAKQLGIEISFREWVRHLIERYAIGQHFFTAARKWSDGIDGFFFHPTDEGYKLASPNLRWRPDPGPTKITASLSLMKEIGLIEDSDQGLQKKDIGTEILGHVLKDPGDR